MTWVRRSRSASTTGAKSGMSASRATPFSRNNCSSEAIDSRTTSPISTSPVVHSARPDSSLAMSRIWLMSRVRRSASVTIMPRKRLRSASSRRGSSCSISDRARIEVSGVRNSWVTVEMKSSFMRSSSRRRSLASRSSAVAASSSCCLASSSRLWARTCVASSRISSTSSSPRSSSWATEATMTRALAEPMAPASSDSANCTKSASAGRWRQSVACREWA